MKKRAQKNIVTGKRESEHLIRMQAELTRMQLQRSIAHSLVGIFAVNTIAALAMIFFVGFGRMILSESLIRTVLAETIAQAAAIFFIVTKSLFPSTANAVQKSIPNQKE